MSIAVPTTVVECVSVVLHDYRITRDTDWAPSSWSLGSVKAEGVQECCEVCANVRGCVVAPYFENICYLKSLSDMTGGSYTKTGVDTCHPVK